MNHKVVFWIGVLGILLFIGTAILGGLLIEGYSISSQYISESYAIDTEYGLLLRLLGYIPSGILITVFCFLSTRYLPPTRRVKYGVWGVGFLYGVGTIIVSIFPCDSGCNPEYINPSISQIIHNFSALLVYAFTPTSIIITGIGLKKFPGYKYLAIVSIVFGALSAVFVGILLSDTSSNLVGIYQRTIELIILSWLFLIAFKIKTIPYERKS